MNLQPFVTAGVPELDRLAENCGFRTAGRWIDTEWQFASSLNVAV